MEFSRQEYWSGLPFLTPGDLPNPEIKPGSPTLQGEPLPSEPPGKPGGLVCEYIYIYTHTYNWRHCQLSGLLFSSPWTAALFWDSWPLLHLTSLPHLTAQTMMHCMFHIFETWYLSFSQGWMNRIYILILSGPGILIFRNLLIIQGTDF